MYFKVWNIGNTGKLCNYSAFYYKALWCKKISLRTGIGRGEMSRGSFIKSIFVCVRKKCIDWVRLIRKQRWKYWVVEIKDKIKKEGKINLERKVVCKLSFHILSHNFVSDLTKPYLFLWHIPWNPFHFLTPKESVIHSLNVSFYSLCWLTN